jgi:hypothetical protein
LRVGVLLLLEKSDLEISRGTKQQQQHYMDSKAEEEEHKKEKNAQIVGT